MKNSPQNVYNVATNALQHQLTFMSRSAPNSTPIFEATEKIIANNLIPNLLKQQSHGEVFAQPTRHGGLNLKSPNEPFDDYTRFIRVYERPNNEAVLTAECLQQRINHPSDQESETYHREYEKPNRAKIEK